MVDWSLYEKLLGVGGEASDSRQVAIAGAVNSFAEGILDDPAYQKDALIEGHATPIVASRMSTIKCSIKALPDTNIHIGDMIDCFGESWIVVELYVDKVGIINGEMWLCNYAIKFQNHSPAINMRQCVVDDGTYSKRSSDPDVVVMTNTYRMYITIDDATKLLYIDKRLGFGEIYSQSGEKILEVYKIIGMDLKSHNYGDGSHLMVLALQRDVYNAETDSIRDNLCDAYKGETEIVAPAIAGSCLISGKSSVRIGTTRKYTVKYTDGNGYEVIDVKPVWDVIAPAGVAVSTYENTCAIDVPLDSNLVGESVILRATDESGEFGFSEMKVQVITIG